MAILVTAPLAGIRRCIGLLAMAGMIALVTAITLSARPAAGAVNQSFIALCYHDVQDSDPDQTFDSVTTANLVQQLSWLQENGYHFVSLNDIVAAHDGNKPLPDKAVLLTFDDGFSSAYTRVFPILKAFHAPAVIGLVKAWMDGEPGTDVAYDASEGKPDDDISYGNVKVPARTFLTWDEVREMARSGLIEVASHTYDSHKGINANPQGNSEPAVVSQRFDQATGAYETPEAYRQRLNDDTAKMAQKIAQETGWPPRAMVWPYGEHSELTMSVAAANGMPITFTLEDGHAAVDRLAAVPRNLIAPDPALGDYVSNLRNIDELDPQRVIQVDLDYIYDPDPAQQEKNLGALIQRVHDMHISTVYLQAFADPDGTGLAKEVYFPNHELPMRADLFNRVAWQLRTRALVKVYAWMPVLAFDFDAQVSRVQAWNPQTGKAEIAADGYRRISPFDPEGRRKITALYEDLARAAPFEGLLFHDDAELSDFEDASPSALVAYAQAGLPVSIAAIRADPATMQRWTRFKTDTLIRFTQDLAAAARRYRSPLRTARNIYARPVLDAASEADFAQQYDRFLQSYDYTAIMAMPQMEQVPPDDAKAWLKQLVSIATTHPLGLKRTIFELQAVDWRKNTTGSDRAIPTKVLWRQMRFLTRLGALNFGYYPDDFLNDQPKAAELHSAFSLQSYAYSTR